MADDSDLREKFIDEGEPEIDVQGLEDQGGDPLQEQSWTKGEKQPNQWQDVPFAILFYAHVVAIIVVAIMFGAPAINDVTKDSDAADYVGLLYLSLIAGGSAWLISAVSLFFMAKFATVLVQIALLFSVVMSLLVAIACVMSGSILGALMGFIFFAIGVCYAWMVWSRIPFAAANLNTGLTAVKSNYGVSLVAYLLVAIAYGWTAVWTLALIGVYDQTADCTNGVCKNDPNGGYIFLLFLGFFWSEQVIQNTIHVTVAGVVGSWWFVPDEASSFCSKAIGDSFFRSVTYSFGSICFGSLLVAIVQALRQLANQARQDDGNNILLCIAECILACLEGIIEYFNKWAYIYVGLYGYSYITAGKNVMTLFRERGWTTIITDDLVSNVLTLMSLVIGGLTGLIGLLIQSTNKSWFSEFDDNDAQLTAFLIAFVVGLVISSILMSVVDSAVNTVIVAFAEAPAEFQANHPEHSEKMRDAWREVYPSECGF